MTYVFHVYGIHVSDCVMLARTVCERNCEATHHARCCAEGDGSQSGRYVRQQSGYLSAASLKLSSKV